MAVLIGLGQERHWQAAAQPEAVVLSSFGGLIGIVLALVVSASVAGMLQVLFVLKVPIGLVGFAAAVDVIFGYVPARKAARLDPIEPLRHE